MLKMKRAGVGALLLSVAIAAGACAPGYYRDRYGDRGRDRGDRRERRADYDKRREIERLDREYERGDISRREYQRRKNEIEEDGFRRR